MPKNGLRTYLYQMITTGGKFLKILNSLQKIYLFWFQYRIAHRILGVNKYLYFSKIIDSQTLDSESLLLLFSECTKVKQNWLDLKHCIEEKSRKVVIFSPSTVILGTLEKYIGLKIIILLVKKYIYQTSRKRCNI